MDSFHFILYTGSVAYILKKHLYRFNARIVKWRHESFHYINVLWYY